MFDLITVALVITLFIAIYLFFTWNDHYWKDRNVPFIPPIPILGNLKPLIMLERAPGPFMGDLYNHPQAKNQRYVGIFIFNNEPALVIRDPELIKNIFVKDFAHFSNRNVECDPKNDPIGVNNLFVLRDKKWKYLRTKLSPTFTSGRIKQMFLLVKEVGAELMKYIENKIDEGPGSNSVVLESKEMLAKYTTDVISTTAFGIQSNSLNDPNATFRHFGKKIFEMTILRSMEVRSFFFMHWMAKTFNFVFLQKEASAFFKKVFWDAMNEREKNNIVRNDFMDTLIRLKNEPKELKEKGVDLSEKEIFEFQGDSLVAQSVLFFTAGFETTSTTIGMTLYELALHPEMQDRLREEIVQNVEDHGGQLTYDGLFEMKYLDMVVSETLRKYPPMPFLDRLCTMDYKVPDSDLIIKKGTPVFVSLYGGLHYDEKYWPDPYKFDPERFTDENKQSRPQCCYLPFGEGPHICIGMRFGLINAKTGISLILAKFKVEVTDKTPIPLVIDNRAIITTVKGDLNLKFVKL